MNDGKLRQLRKAVVIFYCVVFLAMMWPIYPLFSRIHPMLLGIPFSLFYLIVLLLLSFLVMLGLFLLEGKTEEEN